MASVRYILLVFFYIISAINKHLARYAIKLPCLLDDVKGRHCYKLKA